MFCVLMLPTELYFQSSKSIMPPIRIKAMLSFWYDFM